MDYNKETLLRRILFAIATAVFLSLIVAGLGRLYSFYLTGAEPGDALNLSPKIILAHTPEVNWLKDHKRVQEDVGINKFLRQEIEEHYTNSWYLNNLSIKNGEVISIDDSYSESPRAMVEASILSFDMEEEWQRVDLNHNLQLNWLAPDLQICGLRDTGVTIRRRMYDPTSRVIIYEDQLKVDYSVVMTLEDSRWRIRHMVADEISHVDKDTTPIVKDFYLPQIDQIHGVNYYPQDYPWKDFWKSFNDTIVGRDFQIIKEIGFNTIRIFIPYEVFGKGNVDLEQIDNLKTVLSIAERFDLKVIVTLFDFFYDFDLMSYSAVQNHLSSIIDSTVSSNAILAWDVKNEPDLDFQHYGRDQVVSWLDFVIQTIRRRDEKRLITIGWLDPLSTPEFHDKVDFISFHYYEAPEKFSSVVDDLKSKYQKSILIEEYGLPTYNLLIKKNTDEDQAAYYQSMLNQINSEPHVSHALWTLYDFTTIPNEVVGPLPWRKMQQKGYGLIRADSTHKPALQTVQSHLP